MAKIWENWTFLTKCRTKYGNYEKYGTCGQPALIISEKNNLKGNSKISVIL